MDDSVAVSQAIAAVWNDLPPLLGPDFVAFESEVLGCLRLLDTETADHEAVCAELLELFARYPAAHARLVEAFAAVTPMTTRGVTKRPAVAGARHVVLPVYYGTDRAPTGDPSPNAFYGADRGELSLGVVEVAIPDDHHKGRLEKPSLWKLQFSENPDQHVMLLRLDRLDRDRFLARARAELTGVQGRHALIFIHGYKVSFQDAARRAAQVVADLNFEGLPMLYSWPSEDATGLYTVDEANITWTRTHFQEFLELALRELDLESVSIVAHSMGTRALAETLARFEPAQLAAPRARFRHIVFAAPDIDKDTFKDLASSFHGRADRFTLYASSGDLALLASKKIHKYPRAGDPDPEMLLVDCIDSIDASLVDTSFMGHSYFGDNRSVIADLFQLLRHNHDPGERGLKERIFGTSRYWRFT